MKRIRARLRKARNKLARNVLGISRTERRIRHFRQTMHKHHKGSPAYKRARLHLQAAESNLRKLRDRHIFLQTLHDKRLRRKRRWLKKHKDPKPAPTTGLETFDGRTCAAWIVEKALKPARASGYWHGYVISGYRDPAYSESLCYHMCGAPACAGRCAGRSSRHSQHVEPDGAVDVSDSAGLQRWCRAHGNVLRGNCEVLGSDCPHFSHWGN